jgi:murein DD-endopeptidase MepM/ murein hydrolase activator NlpD
MTIRIPAILALTTILAACTQQPAEVVLRDSGETRGGFAALSPASGGNARTMPPASSYASAPIAREAPTRPIDESTTTVARVDHIGSSDLPPPPRTVAPAQMKSESKPAKKDERAGGAFLWPVNGKILSGFGPKKGGKVNDGIDIAAAEGEPVYAAADGEVGYVGNDLKGYGNMVIVKHPGNKNTVYAHLNRASVMRADRVKQGDILGYVGSSGNVKDPQLHFAVRDGNTPVDPQRYLESKVAGLR